MSDEHFQDETAAKAWADTGDRLTKVLAMLPPESIARYRQHLAEMQKKGDELVEAMKNSVVYGQRDI